MYTLEFTALVKHQAAREREFAPFLTRLDASRTVTLLQLLLDPARHVARLDAGWLDVPLFVRRLAAMCEWFSALTPNARLGGWSNAPLVFFQSAPPAEDETEHQRRCGLYGFYRESVGHLPPQRGYLHVETSWIARLVEAPDDSLRTMPLNPFSNRGWHGLIDPDVPACLPNLENGSVIGYRVPDYPSVLGVTAETATEYFVRMVVHDIGHGYLPDVENAEEPLHNVAMLQAMGVTGYRGVADRWERLILSECTDPFFFLDAPELLDAAAECGGPALRRHVIARLRETCCGERRAEDLARLWDIPIGYDRRIAKRCVQGVLEDMRRDGFTRFDAARRLLERDQPKDLR